MIRAAQRFAYVSQRAEDAILLGLTIGCAAGSTSAAGCRRSCKETSAFRTQPLPRRRAAPASITSQSAAVASWCASPGIHPVSALQLIHVSNAGMKGPGRNPDIEAIGPSIGLLIRF